MFMIEDHFLCLSGPRVESSNGRCWKGMKIDNQPLCHVFLSVSVSAVYPLPSFLDVISLKADLVFSKRSKSGLCF